MIVKSCHLWQRRTMSPITWLETEYPRIRRSGARYNLPAFCRQYRYPYLLIYRHLTKRQRPRFDVMALFYRASRGQVGLKDWMDLYDEDTQ